MAISQIPLASTGLTASDLVTQPSYTLIGSYTNTTWVYSVNISLTNPSLYRSFRVIINQLTPAGQILIYIRLNNLSTSNMYKSNASGLHYNASYPSGMNTSHHTESTSAFRLHAQYTGGYQHQSGYIDIHNVNTSENKLIFGTFAGKNNSNYPMVDNFFGEANTSAAITQINFLTFGDPFYTQSTGGISVYGVN